MAEKELHIHHVKGLAELMFNTAVRLRILEILARAESDEMYRQARNEAIKEVLASDPFHSLPDKLRSALAQDFPESR